jgi:hypothetical protein
MGNLEEMIENVERCALLTPQYHHSEYTSKVKELLLRAAAEIKPDYYTAKGPSSGYRNRDGYWEAGTKRLMWGKNGAPNRTLVLEASSITYSKLFWPVDHPETRHYLSARLAVFVNGKRAHEFQTGDEPTVNGVIAAIDEQMKVRPARREQSSYGSLGGV